VITAYLVFPGKTRIVLFVLAVIAAAILGALAWADTRHARRERVRAATQPSRVIEITDDGIGAPAWASRRDDDTFLGDGMADELRRMTEGDGRG
jgi:hypothetical protein